MLKDQLDAIIRNYRITYPQLAERQKEMEKVSAEKDANYIWRALKKVFIRKCNKDERITIMLGIAYPHFLWDMKNSGKAYFMSPSDYFTTRLLFRKVKYINVKYIEAVMQAVCRKAEAEGILWRRVETKGLNTGPLYYRIPNYTIIEWHSFYYDPPKE